jgi:hypothetical protein
MLDKNWLTPALYCIISNKLSVLFLKIRKKNQFNPQYKLHNNNQKPFEYMK